MPREITRADILPMERYEAERKARRRTAMELKRNRRMEVGPYATFYFENYDTMLYQVHEMLYVEKGGESQIGDELAAYNPLIPDGRELVATVMFEIGDAARRARLLAQLGGVEETMSMIVDGVDIAGAAEGDRTDASGKASSVQFLRFPFSDRDVQRLRDGVGEIVVAIDHPNYGHRAVMPDAVRRALAGDFDA